MLIDSMTEEVVDWVEGFIPRQRRDSMNTAIKLTEEVSELMHAMYTDGKNVGEECADVLILLLDIAYLNGVDISEAFRQKMGINRNRTWIHKNGALKHETDR